MSQRPLRIALLSYRGNPHSGGQGIYVRYLSKALVDLGHDVEVFSGQPYPSLHEDVRLTKVASLDLYRSDDPFRRPARSEFRDAIDVAEYGLMCLASYPEPLTFSLRVARELAKRVGEFDVVHDNQSLGYGLLRLQHVVPVVATIHHPCSIDRTMAVANASGWAKKMTLRRWYGFTKMQARVARRLSRIVTVSSASKDDIIREFGVPTDNITVVHNGVDTQLFRPLSEIRRIPGRVVTTASSDLPLKGLVHLIEAIAKVRTERDVSLVVIGKRKPRGPIADAIRRFDLEGVVAFKTDIDDLGIVEEYARAEVAVVPSLYEGFSLPAIEAMSCGVGLVTTTGGALPEVVGPAGHCSLHVEPGDAGAMATAIIRLLDDPALRGALGERGRERAKSRYTWRAAAQRTVQEYEAVRC
ncbi:MAG: glycosyltransferase family 4 protein [Actinobacteria bacterium]|nr:glycosyltransferase family 4 protein [Actinomycetota bacterium]